MVHVANAIAHGLDLSGQDDALVPPLSATGWERFASEDAAWFALFARIERTFDEMSRIMLA